ncbi:MAG: polymer-forming cytoskeletal protein [bacterium]|nr:polymer-forming cytoskeletal protein [bacterium]
MAAKSGGDLSPNVIGENSYFTGSFRINGSLRIDGRFEGKYLQAEKIEIGPNGKLRTNIDTNILIVDGLIIGNINASTRVFLRETARVYGNIKTPELTILNGVILEGQCTIANDLKSSAKQVIEAEYEKNKIIPEEFLVKKTT